MSVQHSKTGTKLLGRLLRLSEFIRMLACFWLRFLAIMQYAGNVLVFGAISPSDGDWFGGIMPADADEFFTGLTDIEVRRLPLLSSSGLSRRQAPSERA